MGTLNIDAIYNILPCEIVSPYILAGYGFTWFKSSNPYLGPDKNRDWIKEAYTGNQFQLGLGASFKFWDDLHIKAEVDYITATNNKIDGNEHANGVKGLLYSNGDTYMNLKLGASWYFWRGEKSKICEPMVSIREVIKEVPVEVETVLIDTVYIDKVIEKAIVKRESFVLENVRFKFDEDVLTNESEIILKNVARVLKKYPEEKIEIVGHTDNWGSDEYNLDLSERRAKSVKKFLVAQGIDSTRLYTAGCGERMPIADNGTPEGRAINRRIEFSIYDGVSSKCPKKEEINKSLIGNLDNEEQEKIADKLMKGDQLAFTNVRFKFDSDELTDNSKKILDNVVSVLNKLLDLNLEIQGHTDSKGSRSYNQNLSEKRANSVRNYLINKGIASERLTAIGFGESNPVATNKTEEGRAKNRRIEFRKTN
jgi:outer membrane protein OmpA-like peptidoglycan-associated protein